MVFCTEDIKHLFYKGPVINNRGGLKKKRLMGVRASKVLCLPERKRGGGVAMLKWGGGHNKFCSSFNKGA